MESNKTAEIAISFTSTSSYYSSDQGNLNSISISSNSSDYENNEMNKVQLQFIDYSSFKDINTLNNGMLKAFLRNANAHVILKKVKTLDIEKLKLLHQLSYHQNILTIFGYSREADDGDYLLVMEFANGGDLRQYLKEKHQKLTWHDKMRLAIDVTNGLQCIHSHGIVHTSLHPHNVLVHNGRMVIGDLGLSKTMDASIPENIEILPYIEPNVLANPSYPRDKRSDIYSLGLLMYEISSEKAPFSSFRHNFEVAKKILSGSRDKPILGTPIEYIDLYEQCWDNDPMARPTVDGVLSILGRMNLTPVYDEDFEMTTFNGNYLKGVERKDVKVKFENSISIEVHPNEANNVVSTSSKNLNSVSKKSGGGVDSGFGEEQMGEESRIKKERKCKLFPCLPRCRITFGVFLCWMCVILIIACIMLGFFLVKMLGNKNQ